MPGAATAHLDERWHRELLDQLCAIERETGSPGERAAATWLVERLGEEGAGEARIEEEVGHHTFWWPLGLAAAAGFVAGVRGIRGRASLAPR